MPSSSPTPRAPIAYALILLGLVATISIGCGGGSTGGGTPGATPTPTPVAPTPTPTPAPAAGLQFSVSSATVPPGGIFQYQLLLTEPKPIGNSSTRPVMPKGPDGPVRGVAVNDSTGQAVGIAVINGTDISVSINSPDASLGTDVDYPLLILTAPVVSTAVGSTFPVALDASSLFFVSGNQYSILENTPGTLTIGGTMSITDVVPGGGVIKAGDTLKILGIGFDATTKIQMNNVNLASTNFISPKEIDVTIGSLCAPETNPCQTVTSMQLDGDRVRAIKSKETVEYFSYDRTDNAPGSSSNPLVALVHPMFSQQLFTVGSFPYVAGGTQFTGIALQNTSTTDATVQIDLLDSAGNALVTPDVELLPARTELVRDIAELFASVPANVATVRATLTTGSPVKMLGMLGDTSNSTVVPVVVTGK